MQFLLITLTQPTVANDPITSVGPSSFPPSFLPRLLLQVYSADVGLCLSSSLLAVLLRPRPVISKHSRVKIDLIST